jgi:CRISPR-associated protein Cmr5
MAQKRAEYALEKVLAVEDKKDFQSFSAGAPAMILQNGFGQTLAFWLAKGTKDGKIKVSDKHIVLFDMVSDWLSLKREDINNDFLKTKERTSVIKELTTMNQRQYLSAQNETLALLEWIKRFANADLT